MGAYKIRSIEFECSCQCESWSQRLKIAQISFDWMKFLVLLNAAQTTTTTTTTTTLHSFSLSISIRNFKEEKKQKLKQNQKKNTMAENIEKKLLIKEARSICHGLSHSDRRLLRAYFSYIKVKQLPESPLKKPDQACPFVRSMLWPKKKRKKKNKEIFPAATTKTTMEK